MLECNRIDFYKIIDVNKTNGSILSLTLKFKLQPEVCNDCHELML